MIVQHECHRTNVHIDDIVRRKLFGLDIVNEQGAGHVQLPIIVRTEVTYPI